MIIWIASYPKSGNTWLRSLLSSYYFSNDGSFDLSLLDRITSFPNANYFKKYPDKFSNPEDTSKYWIEEQKKINSKGKKLYFLKTHMAICKINNNSFTDNTNSLAGIYIIRDPRNVITSLSNHYQISYEKAYEFMSDNKRAIIEKVGERYLGFQPLFSWKNNVKSWVENKKFPVLVIRYEDLIEDTYLAFNKVVDFINDISNLENSFDKKKGKNSVKNTNFRILQNLENNFGFKEALTSSKTKKKIKFFDLGEKNDFKKILPKYIKAKLNIEFEKELKKFKYKND